MTGLVYPFLTPRVHGIADQLYGALRSGWSGGRVRQAVMASRIAATAALIAVPFIAVREMWKDRKALLDQADKARAAGRAAEAEALEAQAGWTGRRIREFQAIPASDKLTGICIPVPGSGHHLKIPVDPTILPLTSLVLWRLFKDDLPKEAAAQGITGDILPNFGPVPALVWGLSRGFDPNTGQPLPEDGKGRARWMWDTLTGRGCGILPGSTMRAWTEGKDAGTRAKRRNDAAEKVPVLQALVRPFWRKSGRGLDELAQRMRREQERVTKRDTATAEAIVENRPVSDDEKESFARHSADPGRRLNNAAQRLWEMGNLEPDQREYYALPDRLRDEISERYRYIEPTTR